MNEPRAPLLQLTCPMMTSGSKSTRKHLGFVLRDDGLLHTYERDANTVDPATIKESASSASASSRFYGCSPLLFLAIEDWFDSSEPQSVRLSDMDYSLVDEKGRFLYIKVLVHSTDPKKAITGYRKSLAAKNPELPAPASSSESLPAASAKMPLYVPTPLDGPLYKSEDAFDFPDADDA